MSEEKKLDSNYVESICMEIISNAGEGRAHVYEALGFFLKGEYNRALNAINEAEPYLCKAHDCQFENLMQPQLKGKEIPFHIIILHAMDLLMVAGAERDMLKTIIISKLSEIR